MKTNNGKTRNRVIVIGLDGATLDLIYPGVKEGKLPTFEKIMKNGAHGKLRTIIPPHSGPAWSSFMTGKNPGKHNVFDFMRQKKGTYNLEPVSSNEIRADTIWDILSKNDKKVVVVNVPVTYPPKKVNGIMVTGMLTPPNAKQFTYPDEFREELKTAVENYIIFPQEVFSKENVDTYRKCLHDTIEKREKLLFHLIKNKEWDFFMFVFMETDIIQHGMFSTLDEKHPQYDKDFAEKNKAQILNVYQKMDKILKNILDYIDKNINENTYLIIMSDHGAGPLYNFFNVNNFLVDEGLIKFKKNVSTKLKLFMFKTGFTVKILYKLFLRLRIGYLRHKLGQRGTVYQTLRKLFLSLDNIDWENTKAYCRGSFGQININLKNRESQGIIPPGVEYEQLRDEIIGLLKDVKNPYTGEKIIGEIYKKEELYSGDYLKKSPDIIFLPKVLTTIPFAHFEFGSNNILERAYGTTGSHRMDGVVFIYGDGIKKSKEIKGAKLIDLAPTILSMLNSPIPTDMDGQILKELFEENSELAKRYTQYHSIDPEKNTLKQRIIGLKRSGKI
jgi:predicted AlkP superfamily phosphohydrolase/phosphomutase